MCVMMQQACDSQDLIHVHLGGLQHLSWTKISEMETGQRNGRHQPLKCTAAHLLEKLAAVRY